MNRRHLLLTTGVAGAAAAGGLWWADRQDPIRSAAPEVRALFEARFDSPTGVPVDMRRLAGRPLLLNFWATWCAPCVREMPEIERFYQDQKPNGWEVLGLAIDRPEAVIPFIEKLNIRFPIAMAGLAGSDLQRQLGNPSGGLPFTVMVNSRGAVAWRKTGETHLDELTKHAADVS